MAIYVRVTAGSVLSQTKWSGSNVDLTFDGVTAVTLEATDTGPLCVNLSPPISSTGICADATQPGTGVGSWLPVTTAANVTWTLLDAPEGTAFDETWFSSNNGGPATPTPVAGVNPLASGGAFIPDMEGTWFFQVTNTLTSDSIYFVVSAMAKSTNIRIPAAGETNQADQDFWNRVYSSMGNEGWAKDRNEALRILNDLSTSGGVQLCYFNDAIVTNPATAPWNGVLKAGAAVALERGGGTYLIPGTGVTVPQVVLATGNSECYYVGLVKYGWESPAQGTTLPGTTRRWPRVKTTSAIPNQSLVLVSRSGSVECETGVNTTSGAVRGQIYFCSAVAGILQAGTDRFALGAAATDYVVPAAMVLGPSATNSKLMSMPAEYLGGISAATDDQSFRFVGLGDFRGVRVGGPQAVAVAGESLGVIEFIALNNEAVTINRGTLVSIATNQGSPRAYVADSNPTVSATKWNGIIGVAIEDVTAGAYGHFAISGPAYVPAFYPVSFSTPMYVGSSDDTSGDKSGIPVIFDQVAGNDVVINNANKIIPVGMSDAADVNSIWLGQHQEEDGFLKLVLGGIGSEVEGLRNPEGMQNYNKRALTIKDATMDLSNESGTANIKVAGSGADDSLVDLDLFECKLSGNQFWSALAAGVGATLSGQVGNTYPGAKLAAFGEVSPRQPVPLYSTFILDDRLFDYNELTGMSDPTGIDNKLFLKLYATLPSSVNANNISIQVALRFNNVSRFSIDTTPVAMPSHFLDGHYPYWPIYFNLTPAHLVEDFSQSVASEYKTVCWEVPIIDNRTISSSRKVSGSVAVDSRSGASATPDLSLISQNYGGDNLGNSTGDEFNRGKIRTVDIIIYRLDEYTTVSDCILTHAVLKSATRKQLKGRRSRFESSVPGYGLLTDNANLLDIHNFAGTISAAHPGRVHLDNVGVNVSTAGARTNNAVYVFIAADPRVVADNLPTATSHTLTLKVYGKFSCPVVGVDTLNLQVYGKEVIKNTEINKDITAAGPGVNTTDIWIPVPSQYNLATNPSVSTSLHEYTIPSPTSTGVIGWWFKIIRTGTLNINAQEDFFLITNVLLESYLDNSLRDYYNSVNSRFTTRDKYQSLLPVPEAIYEHHVHPSEMVKLDATPQLASTRYTRDTDVTGFGPMNRTAPGLTECLWSSNLDARYDDKSGLLVEVFSAVLASGNTIDYSLTVRYSDCFNTVSTATTNIYPIGTVAVDNTAAFGSPATDARYLVHTFKIPPEALWDVTSGHPQGFYDNPDFTEGRNKGTIRFELNRSDSQAINTIILGAVVRGIRPNKSKAGTIIPLNTNEQYSIASARGNTEGVPFPVYVPGYTRSDSRRSLDLSIQRFTWKFSSQLTAGVDNPVVRDAQGKLIPSQYITGHATATIPANTTYGQYIPYSFAITDIYGTCMAVDNPAAPTQWLPVIGASETNTDRSNYTGAYLSPHRGFLQFFIIEVPTATQLTSANPGGTSLGEQAVIVPVDWTTQSSVLHSLRDAIAFPGVENFPLALYPDAGGCVRWNGTNMNNPAYREVNQNKLPKVTLPADYSKMCSSHPAGSQWQLACVFKNTGIASVSPKIELTVEIALIPNHTDLRHSLMGGATSGGRSYFDIPAVPAFPARIPKISDLNIDTSVFKDLLNKPVGVPASTPLSMFIGPYYPASMVLTTPFIDSQAGWPYTSVNSYWNAVPAPVTINSDAADAGKTIVIYGEDAAGAQQIDTIIAAAGDVAGATTFRAIDAVIASAAPVGAQGFIIKNAAQAVGTILPTTTKWGVLDFTDGARPDGIVFEHTTGGGAPGTAVDKANAKAIEFETFDPKHRGRRFVVFGKDESGTFFKQFNPFQFGSGIVPATSELCKTPVNNVNNVTAGDRFKSISWVSILDWGPHRTTLFSAEHYQSPLVSSPFALGHLLTRSWPLDAKVAFAVLDPADSGVQVTVNGFDNAGGALAETIAATVYDPNAAAPGWTYTVADYGEITSITLVGTPVGEWMVGNFNLPYKIENNISSPYVGGHFIAYANVIY